MPEILTFVKDFSQKFPSPQSKDTPTENSHAENFSGGEFSENSPFKIFLGRNSPHTKNSSSQFQPH